MEAYKAFQHSGIMESSRIEAKKAEEHALQEMKRRSGRDAFVERAKDSHHLLSTRVQPGVYRTPYQVASNSVPTVDGTAIEEHLRTLPSVQVRFKLICATHSSIGATAFVLQSVYRRYLTFALLLNSFTHREPHSYDPCRLTAGFLPLLPVSHCTHFGLRQFSVTSSSFDHLHERCAFHGNVVPFEWVRMSLAP